MKEMTYHQQPKKKKEIYKQNVVIQKSQLAQL